MTTGPRNVVIRRAVIVWLSIGTVLLVSCDGGTSDGDPPASDASPSASVAPEAPSFGFDVGDREVVATAPGHLTERERRGAREAADRVESALTDLYVAAFLDPERWASGTYDEVFDVFAGVARPEAQRRTGILTAGGDAADRFERIEPRKGRLTMRILLDRGGKPVLVSSAVRFLARSFGADPLSIRSEGTFVFQRIDGAWRIVSFDVARGDREREAA
jgi:hypothetical protein